jgi:hypothetical protein
MNNSNLGWLKFKIFSFRFLKGAQNKLKYGSNGPQFGELIYINPQNHSTGLPFKHRSFSGVVLGGDWDLQKQINIEKSVIYKACSSHWVENVPWEETGIYQYMLDKIERFGGEVDNCRNINDIIIRYRKLDKLYEEVKKSKRFKTQRELNFWNFNEHGGLLFHIDRNNNPIYGAGGMHRFAMAKVLGLKVIPAQLGVVHKEAIKSWKTHKKIDVFEE